MDGKLLLAAHSQAATGVNTIMRHIGGLVLWLVSGCVGKVDEDNYAEKFGEALCRTKRDCSAADFYMRWDDIPDCAEDLSKEFVESAAFYSPIDECNFDERSARDCLRALNRVSCESYLDSFGDAVLECADLWRCGGDESGSGYYEFP